MKDGGLYKLFVDLIEADLNVSLQSIVKKNDGI